MTAPPALLPNRHVAVGRPRYGAAHEQQVAIGIHADDRQAQLGEVAVAHVARHPLALDDARRIGPRSDRARLAVTRVAVGRRSSTEMIPVHDPLEPFALRDTRDLHPL